MARNYTVGENTLAWWNRTEAEQLDYHAHCTTDAQVQATYRVGAAICREMEKTQRLMREHHREMKYR